MKMLPLKQAHVVLTNLSQDVDKDEMFGAMIEPSQYCTQLSVMTPASIVSQSAYTESSASKCCEKLQEKLETLSCEFQSYKSHVLSEYQKLEEKFKLLENELQTLKSKEPPVKKTELRKKKKATRKGRSKSLASPKQTGVSTPIDPSLEADSKSIATPQAKKARTLSVNEPDAKSENNFSLPEIDQSGDVWTVKAPKKKVVRAPESPKGSTVHVSDETCLIFKGLPNSCAETPRDRVLDDQRLISDVLKILLKKSETVQYTKAFRLGSAQDLQLDINRSKPLKVVFSSQGERDLVFSRKILLKHSIPHVFIEREYTVTERQNFRLLREEMSRRKAAGAVNLVIRRGKIVQKDHYYRWNSAVKVVGLL